jgi:hypothetical protein
MQYHSIKGVVALTHYGGESHLGNFNKMIEDLVVHPERNRTIANILLASYDVQFLLITSIHKQVDLIDDLLLHGEKFYTITHDDVEELIANVPGMDVHRFQTRLLAISFVAFEKLVHHYLELPVGTPNILDGLGGFVVGTPHKNIDTVIEYAYTFHNSTAKHKHGNQLMGSKFKYVGHDSCAVYDIADNHELLSMWATWHEDKYLRMKLMDPNPPMHHEESKNTSNIVVPKEYKAQVHYNQKYHGILNDLGTPNMKLPGEPRSPTAAETIASLGTKDSPLSSSPEGSDLRRSSLPVVGDSPAAKASDYRRRSLSPGPRSLSPVADGRSPKGDRGARGFAREYK